MQELRTIITPELTMPKKIMTASRKREGTERPPMETKKISSSGRKTFKSRNSNTQGASEVHVSAINCSGFDQTDLLGEYNSAVSA